MRSVYSPQICSGDSYHENDLSISSLWCGSLYPHAPSAFILKILQCYANMTRMYVCIVGCGCMVKSLLEV